MHIEMIDEFQVGDRVVSIVDHSGNSNGTGPMVKPGMVGTVTKIFKSQANPGKLISDWPFDVVFDEFSSSDIDSDDFYPMAGYEISKLDS